MENEVDNISKLPDAILHLILSRLDSTIDVVRTSVLSTRWKYLWTSVPCLHINVFRKPTYRRRFNRDELIEFVDWVLLNTTTLHLDTFTFDCSAYYHDMSPLTRWIHAVVMRNVRNIHLKFSLDDYHRPIIVLPPCLLHSASLEMLTLNLFFYSLSLETFTGSKTLKVLRLDSVELLDHHLVQSFFVNCPLLQDLSLINCITRNLDYLSISCPNLKTLMIDDRGLGYASFMRYDQYRIKKLCERLTVICPKLVYFAYGGHMAHHFSFDVKSLKKAVIRLEDMKPNAKRDDNYGVTICELVAQVSHVEYLSINRFFHRNISSYEVKRFFEELEGVETRRTLTRHLKRVEFSDFKGEKETLDIARFLLEHGNALEEMVFSRSDRDIYHKQIMKAMDKVSNFYKASSSVKVITLKLVAKGVVTAEGSTVSNIGHSNTINVVGPHTYTADVVTSKRQRIQQPDYGSTSGRANSVSLNKSGVLIHEHQTTNAQPTSIPTGVAPGIVSSSFSNDTDSIGTSSYAYLGNCNYSCQHCGARFWYEERIKNNAKEQARPKYHRCCMGGCVVLRTYQLYLEYIKLLLTDRHFLENIRAHNQMFSMTSLVRVSMTQLTLVEALACSRFRVSYIIG
ncbi:F-box domain containing protein [Tanacetum coccineum]